MFFLSREKLQIVIYLGMIYMIIGLKERFAIVREKIGQNTKDFAASLGMESTTVSSIESGKREPSKEVLCNLASKFAINLNWVLTGEGEIFLSNHEKSLVNTKNSSEGYKVPLLRQKVSCGSGIDWQNENNIVDYIDVFDQIPRLKIERLFALCVEGSSMLGAGIRNGDYVLFNSAKGQWPHDGIYVIALDGEVYCKRLEFDIGKTKIYSVRFADLDKAELVATIDNKDISTADRLTILGRVHYWIHPNLDD
jgi:SOS-response transcriptional repressor LexA